MSAARAAAWPERGLAVLGSVLLLYAGTIRWDAYQFQRKESQALDVVLAASAASPRSWSGVPGRTLATGALIGSLEIPRLRLSVMVTQGDDDSVFAVGLGHLPDTPFPWQGGNVAVAGHRDTFFRPLRQIAAGDRIQLRTQWGEFSYRVRQTLVVDPGDLSVLNPTDRPTLTLITCYPFSYIGRAPRRFIVRADEVADPD